MQEIRWGFIGCGDVVEKKSGPAFASVSGSRVVAVMSRREERARSYAERHGVPRWYTDAQELIDDPEVNAIYVATPPSSHAAYAIMAMRAGKAVYVEKPLAANYDDCARINRVSEQTGVPCFVAYYRRHMPYFLKVKELVKSGALGEVTNVVIRYAAEPRPEDHATGDNQPWRVNPDTAGGGYFYDMAPHQLDLLQDLFGVITEAHGMATNRGGLYAAEDTVAACFRFESGIVGGGSWCFVSHRSAEDDRVEIIGTKGSLCFSVFNFQPIRLHTANGVEQWDIACPQYVQQPMIAAVTAHLLGRGRCESTSVATTPVNWALDRILGKI